MKLLTKLSLSVTTLLLFTTLVNIFFSVSSIKEIIYDLNAKVIKNDLNSMHHTILDQYLDLKEQGLEKDKGHLMALIQHISEDYLVSDQLTKLNFIILDSKKQPLFIGKHLQDKEVSLITQHFSMSAKKEDLTTIKMDRIVLANEEQVLFYKGIPQWGLNLVIVFPKEELYTSLNEYITQSAKLLMLVIVITLLTIFIYSNHLSNRIKIALKQIKAVTDDVLHVRIKPIKGNDEIAQLHRGLNDMTEIISDKMIMQAKAELKAINSQKEMQEKHTLLSAFINTMPELAFILDEEGEYVEVFGNENQLLYQRKERLLGQKITEVLPKGVAKIIMMAIKLAITSAKTQTVSYELKISGESCFFQANITLFEHSIENKHKKQVIFIAHDVTQQINAQHEAYHLSLYDPLTDLPNRRLLIERLEQEIIRLQRHDQLGALLFIDLDDFKTINDSRGHQTGDLLLKEVARRLRKLIRKNDLACRLGGDEFVILLSNMENNIVTASSRAQTVAYKTLEMLQAPYELEGEKHQISCSIGIVMFPEAGRNSHDLIKYADIAMYQAKDDGKNTVKLFAPHMQVLLENRLQLQKDLRVAIKENSLMIHLQPQYNEDSIIISAEALVRWQHPEKGFISPAEFIPIAEESGLVHALGKSVMELVLKELKILLGLGLSDQFKGIAINVSPWQFGREDYFEEVKTLLDKYQVPAKYVELEITEQTLVGNFSSFSEKMKIMQDMGIHFSIDDFGTGYSSLSYLKSLPVNMLKIDQTFIRDVTKDKNDDAIVNTIIVMAKSLGMEVIAEGVETKEQLDFLLAHECYFFQGYYFSKPVPTDVFTELLLASNKQVVENKLSS